MAVVTALTKTDADRRQRFMQAFNRTVAAFPNATADAARLQVYYDALSDMPLEAIERAAVWFQKHGGDFFPTAAKWHERAELENTQALRDSLHQARAEPWKVECSACDDTGWEHFECGGGPACGRRNEHAAHSYVVPCACRQTNSTYKRNREREFAGKGQA